MQVDLIFFFPTVLMAYNCTVKKFLKVSTSFYMCIPFQALEFQVLYLEDRYVLIASNRHDEPKMNKSNMPGTD